MRSNDKTQGWDPRTEGKNGSQGQKARMRPNDTARIGIKGQKAKTECKDGIHGQKSRKDSKERQ
jgi:hypothetical protein